MAKSPRRAILIAGPTASGKSALALALAERLSGVVINADSMQVYRELRILTARPSAADEVRAPHVLYGHVSGAESYSAGRFVSEAEAAIGAAIASGRVPIITGGTGLYFKALLDGLSPIPEIPQQVRSYWRSQASRLGAEELHAQLARRDPVIASRLKPSDSQRLTRALEVLDATGRSLAQWQQLPGTPVLDAGETVRLVVAPERDVLYQRCDARFDEMLGRGALQEVANLATRQLDPSLPAMRALGVRPLLRHLLSEIDLSQASALARTETRQYAKRQLTWLRLHMIAWNWLNTKLSKSIIDQSMAFIDR